YMITLTLLPYLLLFLCLFFFSSYGDHRDLHSFPTRRSSDLLLCLLHQLGNVSAHFVAYSSWGRMVSGTRVAPYRWINCCTPGSRSEEHTSELQSRENLVCRLLLEKKKNKSRIKQCQR